jgi:hypothetical protein
MRIRVSLALFLGLGLGACEKKVSQTTPAFTPPPLLELGGEDQSCPASFALGTFTPLAPLDLSKITSTIAEVSEQEIPLAKNATNAEGGLYHTLLITLSSSLATGSTSSEVSPDGYQLDICPAPGGACETRFIGKTALLRFMPSSKLILEARPCLQKSRVQKPDAQLADKSFNGENYLCGKSSGRKLYILKENSGNTAEFSQLMANAELVDEVYHWRAYALHRHMRENHAPLITHPNQKLSDLESALQNNIVLGPETFADSLELDGFASFDALNQGSADKLSETTLGLSGGCSVSSAASDQSLDEVMTKYNYGKGSSSLNGASSSSSGTFGNKTTSTDPVGYTDSSTPAPTAPVDTSIPAQMKRHAVLISGIVVTLTGALLYYTAKTKEQEITKAKEKAEAEAKEKKAAQIEAEEAARAKTEATEARAAEKQRLSTEVEEIRTAIEERKKARQEEFTNHPVNDNQKKEERRKKALSQEQAAFENDMKNLSDSLTTTIKKHESLTAEEKKLQVQEKLEMEKLEAQKKPSAGSAPTTKEWWNSDKGLNTRQKSGLGIMAAGLLITAFGAVTAQLTEVPAKNILTDETFLDLTSDTFDVLDLKDLVEAKAASRTAGEAQQRTLPAVNP